MTASQIHKVIEKYKRKVILSITLTAITFILLNLLIINYIYTGPYMVSYAMEIAYASLIINISVSLTADMFKKIVTEVLEKNKV